MNLEMCPAKKSKLYDWNNDPYRWGIKPLENDLLQKLHETEYKWREKNDRWQGDFNSDESSELLSLFLKTSWEFSLIKTVIKYGTLLKEKQ